jgi:hypothetical protein
MAGQNKFMCPGSCLALVNGFSVSGVCVAQLKCKAVDVPGLSGSRLLELSIGPLLTATGVILGGLIKGGAGSGAAAPPQSGYSGSYPSATGCTTYTPTSNVALLSTPCTYYVPADGGTGTGTGGTCSAIDQALGVCGGTLGSTNASISATPTSGPPPLGVTFTIADSSTGCTRDPIVVSYGDSSTEATVFAATSVCGTRSPVTLTHTYSTAGTFVAKVKNGASGAELSSVAITAGSGAVGGATPVEIVSAALAASPSSGAAPLTVSIIASDTSPTCPHAAIGIRFGDGTAPIGVFDGTTSCSAPAQQFTHTYQAAGAYQLALIKADGSILRSLTIAVGGSGASTRAQTGVQTTYDPNVSPVAPGTQSSVGQVASTLPQGGPTGDIKLFGTGVTVIASSLDTTTNTTVAGFYGGNTTMGITDKSLASRLCVSRPWSTNFLSYVIPATFFDSLCTMRGYQVGTTTPAVAAALAVPVVTVPKAVPAQTQVQLIQQPAKPVQSAKPAPPVPAIPAVVDIWAVPAKVPLGSRTVVEWRSEGVESCNVSSPDGSFSHNTTKGISATVPIIAPTTYTISCLTADKTPVTDYFTVQIAI